MPLNLLKFLYKLEHTCSTLLAQAAGVRICIQQTISDIYYLQYIILLGCLVFFASLRRTSEAYLNSGMALKRYILGLAYTWVIHEIDFYSWTSLRIILSSDF